MKVDKLKRAALAFFGFVKKSLRVKEKAKAVVIVVACLACVWGGFWAHTLVICLGVAWAARLFFKI